MRKLVIFISALFALTSIASADAATLLGQQITNSGQVKFGNINFSKTLYVTGSSPYYLVDSTNGARVKLDTAALPAGSTVAVGASSQSILIQSVAGIMQQSNCEISYKIRATDISQAGVLLTAFGQYKTPWVDTDTAFTAQAYLWGQDTVLLTHTPPAPTVAWSTRRWYFMPAGDNLRINVKRINLGPADTVVIKMEARCR